ncbi:MAG: hypothetical protein DMG38_03630 [Acidobacteria bacterium]|nr:MAG: hypothetical protein DMG38_03630 [Acidobacteriota bacterium]
MTVVIVVVPVAIGVPAVGVFLPPTMMLVPAALARFMQFVTSVTGLPAVPAMMLDGFVQFVVGLDDAPLTTSVVVVVVSEGPGRGRECEQASQRCARKYHTSRKLLLSQRNPHVLTILQEFPDWDGALVALYQTRLRKECSGGQ